MSLKHYWPIMLCVLAGCGESKVSDEENDSKVDVVNTNVGTTQDVGTGDVINLPQMDSGLGPLDDKGVPLPPAPPTMEKNGAMPGLPSLPGKGGQLELPGLPTISESGELELPGLPPIPDAGESQPNSLPAPEFGNTPESNRSSDNTRQSSFLDSFEANFGIDEDDDDAETTNNDE
jgi:hypothetical protein